ncbi:MAG: O-antigen ligase family protein [Ignavibacteria bacterium]|nr:O-antigen ligase family protein [Ignavibacteria bacterium]
MIQSFDNIFDFDRKIVLFAFLIAFSAVIFSSYLFLVVPLIILCGILFMIGKKLIYPFFVIIFIALPGDIGESARTAINIVGSLTLVFLLLKKYQFHFDQYVKIDRVLFRLILLILGSLILSTLLSANVFVGVKEVLRQIVFFIIFYLFYSEFSERGKVFNVLISLVVSGVIVSLGIAYDVFSSGMQLIYLELAGLGKSGGFYKNVSAAGGILAISLPLAVSFLSLKKGNEKWIKLVLLASILLQAIALLATNSRGAILSVVVSLVLFSYFLSPKKFRKVFIFIALFAFLILLLPTTSEVISLYFRTGRIFANTRYLIWQIAFSIISSNLFFGIGPGMFKYYMYPNLPVMLGSWNESQIAYVYKFSGGGQAHNFFLMQTSELGVVGLVVTLLLIAYVLKTSFRLMQAVRCVSHQYYILSNIIFSIFIGLLVRSFFEATGILSNGWLSRDLPFWLLFLSVLIIKSKVEKH